MSFLAEKIDCRLVKQKGKELNYWLNSQENRRKWWFTSKKSQRKKNTKKQLINFQIKLESNSRTKLIKDLKKLMSKKNLQTIKVTKDFDWEIILFRKMKWRKRKKKTNKEKVGKFSYTQTYSQLPISGMDFLFECSRSLTRRNREVIDFTRYRVKNFSQLTNLKF